MFRWPEPDKRTGAYFLCGSRHSFRYPRRYRRCYGNCFKSRCDCDFWLGKNGNCPLPGKKLCRKSAGKRYRLSWNGIRRGRRRQTGTGFCLWKERSLPHSWKKSRLQQRNFWKSADRSGKCRYVWCCLFKCPYCLQSRSRTGKDPHSRRKPSHPSGTPSGGDHCILYSGSASSGKRRI